MSRGGVKPQQRRARPRPTQNQDPKPASPLPMEIQIGDRDSDEEGEREVVGHPATIDGAKSLQRRRNVLDSRRPSVT